MIHLDLTTARLFIATVEEESIAHAAAREGIASSAVSKRIQQLELEIGLPLLRRHRRGIELTSAGMVILRRARAMLHEATQLEADLNEMRAGLSGRVRLCANETALVEFIPRLLPQFTTTYPGVEIELEECPSAPTVRNIWQNASDIGIYAGDVPPVDLWRRPLFRDRLVLVLRPDHTLATKAEVSMVDILNHEVIGQPTGGSLSTLLNRAAAAYGRVLKMRLFADGYDTVCRLVGQGLAIGIISEGSAKILAPQLGLLRPSHRRQLG